MPQTRTTGMAARIAAWLSLALGIYGVLAAATVLGLFTGAAAGLLGLLLSVAVLIERPVGRLRRVALVALVLNAIPVVAGGAVLIVVSDWPWEL